MCRSVILATIWILDVSMLCDRLRIHMRLAQRHAYEHCEYGSAKFLVVIRYVGLVWGTLSTDAAR